MLPHEPGSEYLAAYPLYAPGLPPILLGAVKGAGHLSSPEPNTDFEYFRPIANDIASSPTRPTDHFSSLPLELRLLIIDFLRSNGIARLSMTSKSFANLPDSSWYKLVRREMPWLWEAWDEPECVHDPSL